MGRVETKFKQTEVGLVPMDWEVKKLGEVAEVERGASPRPIEDPKWFDNNSLIGWVRISDVTSSTKILQFTTQKLSDLGIKNSRYVERGNLIMSICATIGRPILTRIDVCIHDGFVVFRKPTINKEYLYYFLSFIEKDWSKNGQTGSQMNLNTNLIKKTEIYLPPTKTEQTAIANALSDADGYIESLEKLIDKKQKIKQGAMQQLLKPKENWEVKPLGKVIHLQGGYAFKSDLFTDVGVPIIRISNINSDVVSFENSVCYKKFNIQKEFIVKKGDALIAMSGATTGKIGVYNDEKEAYINQRVGKLVVLDDKKYSYEFVSHIIRSKKFLEELFKQISQGAQPNISGKQIESIELSFPKTKTEQQKIAQTLSDIDNEITALNQKLTKAKAIKQGMMQQLLTGKIRLI